MFNEFLVNMYDHCEDLCIIVTSIDHLGLLPQNHFFKILKLRPLSNYSAAELFL